MPSKILSENGGKLQDPNRARLINNYMAKNREKIQVEIELPCNIADTHLKYSLSTTNSNDNKSNNFTETRKSSKGSSKDRDTDHDDILNKFNEDAEIVKNTRIKKKAPVKNAKAFLTSSFPKGMKSESQKSTKSNNNEIGVLQRFSSATSKGKNILEIETFKSNSKESRGK
jgi:hypothetical protein